MPSRRSIRDPVVLSLVFVTLGALTTTTWWLMRRHEVEALREATEITAQQVAYRLEDHIRARLLLVEHMRDDWVDRRIMTQDTFTPSAQDLEERFQGFQAINWIDPTGVIRIVVPEESNEAAIGQDLHRHPEAAETFALAERSGEPRLTRPVHLFQGGLGFAAYFPLIIDGEHDGYLNAVFRSAPLVESCLRHGLFEQYHIRITDGNEEVYRSDPEGVAAGSRFAAVHPVRVLDRSWRLTLVPTREFIASAMTPMDEMMLALGLVLTVALVWLLRMLLRQQGVLRTGLEQVRLSEERYRLLVENVNDGIVISQSDGFVFMNRRFAEMLSYEQADLEAKTCREIYTDQGLQVLADRSGRRQRGEAVPATYETWLRRRDGAEINVEANATDFEYRGAPATFAVIRDIGERKRAEEAMRKTQQRQTHILRSAPITLYSTQAFGDYRTTWVSEEVEHTTGFPPSQFLDSPGFWASRLHPEDRARVLRECARVPEVGKLATEYRLKRADGSYRWLLDHAVLFRDEQGRPVETFGCWLDITERRRAEEALHETNARLAFQNAVAQAAALSPTSEELCDRLVEIVRGAMPCDGFIVDIYDAARSQTRGIRVWDTVEGEMRPVPNQEVPIDPNGPLFTTVIQGRQPLLIHREDPERESHRYVRFGDSVRPSASLLWAPMVVGDRVAGMISVQSYTPGAYTAREVDLLVAIAQQAGPALEASLLGGELRERERQYRSLVETSNVIPWEFDPAACRFTYVGPQAERLLGFPVSEWLKENFWVEHLHPEDREWAVECCRSASEKGGDHEFECRMLAADGRVVWLRNFVGGVAPESLPVVSRPARLRGHMLDITARKQAEREITMLAHAVRSISEAVCITDLENRILFVNQALLTTFGYEERELLGESAEIFWADPTAAPTPEEVLEATLAGGWQGEVLDRRRDGSTLPVFLSASPIHDERGQPIALVGVTMDMSERRRAEQALREALVRFEAVIEKTPLVAIQGLDQSGVIRHWNSASQRLHGFSAGEAVGRRIQDLIGLGEAAGDFERTVAAIWKSALASLPQEWLTHTRDGQERWVYAAMFPVVENGAVVEIFCMAVDITQRKSVEEALRERNGELAIQNAVAQSAAECRTSEELCDRLVHIVLGVVPCHAFTVELFDASARRMRGLRAYDTIDGKLCAVPLPEEDSVVHPGSDCDVKIIQRRQPHLVHRTDPERESRPLQPFGDKGRASASLLWVPLLVGDHVFGVISAQSYTPNAFSPRHVDLLVAIAQQAAPALEATLLGEQLRESEQRLRTLFQGIDDTLLVHDHEGRILDCNEAACRRLGYSRAQLLSMRITDIDSPESAAAFPGRRAQQMALGHFSFEGEQMARDGRRISVDVSTSQIVYEGRPAILAVVRDITERQRAEEERRRIQAQLLRTQKLESLGVLAGGIAHDFNNLLTGILGNAQLAVLDIAPHNPAHDALDEVLRAAERAAMLTRQMLAYSGRGSFEIRPIDLTQHVREITPLLQTSFSNKKVHLRLELADALPAVEADTAQLQQLIMNLVINGAEAIGDTPGTVLVTTGLQEIDAFTAADLVAADNLEPGLFVFLEVHDDGSGMDDATKARIFDPFFTTKFTGRGLGLAAVLGIVRGHRGALKVYSTPGRGTTFKVFFPVSSKDVQTAAAAHSPDDLNGHACVLIIDDEEIVRQVARHSLEPLGHTVLLADNGRRGLEVFQAHASEIDVVLLDMTMPVMGGEETFRELRHLRPDVKVLLTSGYNEVEATRHFVAKGLAGFIQKPFAPRDLAAKIRQIVAPDAGATSEASSPGTAADSQTSRN